MSSSSSPTSSCPTDCGEPQPLLPKHMPFMFPPFMFAMPGASPFAMHPMYYNPPGIAVPYSKQGMMMMPMMMMSCPDQELMERKMNVPTNVDQALCRPAARRTSLQLQTHSELISLLHGSITCQVELQASAQSAFRPTGMKAF